MRLSPTFATSILAGIITLMPLAASADVTPSMSLGIGTPGFGISIGTPIGQRFDARLQYGSFDYSTTTNSSDNSYTGQLHMRSIALLGDYHPFGSAFILSTGIFAPNFTLNGQANKNADGTFTIDSVTYTGIDSLGGTIKWTRAAPYFGIGWRPLPEQRGLGFYADLGAAFIGSPQVDVTATGSSANTPAVQSSLAAERQSIQDSANFKVFPVFNVGVTYRFGAPQNTENPEPPPTEPENQAPPSNNQNEFPDTNQ